MSLTFRTPAKINLGLKILHKRPDGFHELQTLLQMVSLGDEMVLEELPDRIELQCDQPDIPQDETNLAVRAARLLKKEFPERARNQGVRINLTKRIPAGGGLGGGSGNAAGTLLGLNKLWDLGLARKDLMILASQLGSDVPFFLCAPCALGEGRGERATPSQPPKKFDVILIYPGFPIATPWVYQNLNLKLTKNQNDISILQNFLSKSDISGFGSHLFNDLEPVVIQRYPVIQTIKNELKAWGAVGSLLSGSGSVVFGVFDRPETANLAYNQIKNKDWNLFLTHTLENLVEVFPEEMLNYP